MSRLTSKKLLLSVQLDSFTHRSFIEVHKTRYAQIPVEKITFLVGVIIMQRQNNNFIHLYLPKEQKGLKGGKPVFNLTIIHL